MKDSIISSRRKSMIVLIATWCENGSLRQFMEQKLPEWNLITQTIILGIPTEMKYMNSCDIVHRDPKIDNILINGNFYPIICDF